jgi:NADH:ubiquinone oxidoreductase subunit D
LPVEDTLNIKNGMNYAQFLEAILRIAYIKAEENNTTFKMALEKIF